MTLQTHKLHIPDYEQVIEVIDENVGLHAFIAIHSTSLGPSLGGIRIYPYPNKEEALQDVLRLSKAMSYKSALAETGLGGGKSVIMADPRTQKTESLLLSFAAAVDQLNGVYIAAEDVGTCAEDMIILRKRTPYVVALPTSTSSGDPAPFTAFGVFKGIQAVAQQIWGSTSLKSKKIALQGLGHVGAKLADLLFWEGAELILADIDSNLVETACRKYGARSVLPAHILETPCDIFSPCAMGGILSEETIPLLRCMAVAGSANNQLAKRTDGKLLLQRSILHAPGYVINAGGIINVSCEFDPSGYNPATARDKIAKIYDRLLLLFEQAAKEGKAPSQVADEAGEWKLLHGIGKRLAPIHFT